MKLPSKNINLNCNLGNIEYEKEIMRIGYIVSLLAGQGSDYIKIKDKVETINIWNLLKYIIIEKELQDNKLEIPFVISSSVF